MHEPNPFYIPGKSKNFGKLPFPFDIPLLSPDSAHFLNSQLPRSVSLLEPKKPSHLRRHSSPPVSARCHLEFLHHLVVMVGVAGRPAQFRW